MARRSSAWAVGTWFGDAGVGIAIQSSSACGIAVRVVQCNAPQRKHILMGCDVSPPPFTSQTPAVAKAFSQKASVHAKKPDLADRLRFEQ